LSKPKNSNFISHFVLEIKVYSIYIPLNFYKGQILYDLKTFDLSIMIFHNNTKTFVKLTLLNLQTVLYNENDYQVK